MNLQGFLLVSSQQGEIPFAAAPETHFGTGRVPDNHSTVPTA